MKLAYWVVTYRSISDESAVKAYGALAVPAGGPSQETTSQGLDSRHC